MQGKAVTRVADSAKCPVCGGELALTTLYGRPMRVLEGSYAGMFEAECTQCAWYGYAPLEVAREIRQRRGMYSRK